MGERACACRRWDYLAYFHYLWPSFHLHLFSSGHHPPFCFHLWHVTTLVDVELVVVGVVLVGVVVKGVVLVVAVMGGGGEITF